MTRTFEIEAPHGRRSRLPFATFAEAVAAVVPGFEILAEYDGCTSTPGEFADSAPIWSGGTLVALVNREDPKNPTSRYVRTSVAKARPAYLDADLLAFIQAAVDSGHLTSPGLCRTGEGLRESSSD